MHGCVPRRVVPLCVVMLGLLLREEFRATKENDLHRIQIGDERYEIPDAVILGG